MMRLKKIIDPDYAGIFYRSDKYHNDELNEAYECGRKDGWREAMEEAERYYERRGNETHIGAGGRILFRRHSDPYMEEDEDIEWRRRRDERGRYM